MASYGVLVSPSDRRGLGLDDLFSSKCRVSLIPITLGSLIELMMGGINDSGCLRSSLGHTPNSRPGAGRLAT